jgi:hypothetical protein
MIRHVKAQDALRSISALGDDFLMEDARLDVRFATINEHNETTTSRENLDCAFKL